ncbi:MAG: ABC transporter ATP-binding protein [Anaerolineales bacterium]|nr:ABC transporter ATP-binding protein [Anaerolineales bacterium]
MKQLLRLRIYVRPYWPQILFSLLLLLALTGLSLIVPGIIQRVLDIGLVRRDVNYLIQSALLILGIGAVRAVLSYFQRYISEWVAQHIGYDLRNRLYDHIQHLSFTYHDHAQSGQLISRCIEDVRAVERFSGSIVIELIQIVLLLAGVTTLLFSTSPRLAAIALLPVIPLILMTTSFGKRIGGFFFDVDYAIGDLSSRLQENVSGVQVVRAFARESHEIQRFSQANRVLFKARVRVLNEWSKIMPSTQFLVTAGTLIILWFGGQMVLNGELTIGELVAFNSYLLMLSAPAQQLTWMVNAAGEAVAGAQRTFEVLDTIPEIQSPQGAVQLPALSGKVEFSQVSFQYAGEKAAALSEISLTVQPNQVVALIGPTGSGKTSLVNLIPRFYDVSQGAVLVDGYDVRQVDLVSLRKQIGIVLQTSLLFSASIAENIAYGRPDASREEIVAAAKAAQADEFIQGLPDGYDTVVGERGITLSGGQRQRVAIARALLMDPRILILDDSTSSVDMQTERQIQQALSYLMEGRTTFVIAHRLSTVRRADLILVMDRGQVVERGKHSELIQQQGLYREIYELQLRDQETFREDMEALGMANQVKIAPSLKSGGIE